MVHLPCHSGESQLKTFCVMQLGWPILGSICVMHSDVPWIRHIRWYMVLRDALKSLDLEPDVPL